MKDAWWLLRDEEWMVKDEEATVRDKWTKVEREGEGDKWWGLRNNQYVEGIEIGSNVTHAYICLWLNEHCHEISLVAKNSIGPLQYKLKWFSKKNWFQEMFVSVWLPEATFIVNQTLE